MHWWHWRAQLFFSVSISSPCLSPQTDSPCLLMPISFLCPRSNSSAPEIRCPWLLALACVMLYWEAITRYDRAKSVLQESVSGCNNLEQRKKNSTGKKKTHNRTSSASAQGGEKQAPVMIILWAVLCLALRHLCVLCFGNLLARWGKSFQSKRKNWQKLGVKTHLD